MDPGTTIYAEYVIFFAVYDEKEMLLVYKVYVCSKAFDINV